MKMLQAFGAVDLVGILRVHRVNWALADTILGESVTFLNWMLSAFPPGKKSTQKQ